MQFSEFMPLPGSMVSLFFASFWSSSNKSMPSSAFSSCPEVNKRWTPKAINWSNASYGLDTISKALWKVKDMGLESSINSLVLLISMVLSSCSTPETIPAQP